MKYITVACLCAALFASGLSLATTTAEADSVETTLVTATRSEQPAVNLPASIQVIDAEQIKLSGANHLVQLLNAQAGVQVKDTIGNQGRGASVSLRGFGENSTNNVLILVDGRKLNNPSLAGADLASIAIKDIERVEIIQGSAGTLYGDQATGGVINIVTKQAGDLAGFVETSRGSDNLESYQAAISQSLDNGLNYRASAEHSLGDNYRDNNEADYDNVFARLGYRQTRYSVFVEGQRVNDNLRLPGALSAAQSDLNRRQSLYPQDFSNRDTEVLRLGGDLKISGNWQLLAEFSDRDEESQGVLFFGDFTNATDVKTFTPRLAGEFRTDNGSWLVTAGVDLEESDYQATNAFGATKVEQQVDDIYLQVIAPISQHIDLTVGTRRSEFEFEDLTSSRQHDDDVQVFQLGLSAEVGAASRAFLRRDEGFRWANADENGFVPPTIEFLEAQQSTSWELGYEWNTTEFFLSAMVYRMIIDNEIIYDPAADGPFGPGTGANINLDESLRRGAIMRGVWRPVDAVNLELNYSYTDAEFSAGNFDGNTVPFVAERTANAILSYQLSELLSIYLDAQYTGPRYPSGDDANIGDQFGGYTLYNASLRLELDAFYAQLRLNNLSGKRYSAYSGGLAPFDYQYPAPEDTLQISVGFRFQ